MYLGVKWEDSRIINMDETVKDLQVGSLLFLVLYIIKIRIRMVH